ncbi:protein of unknown function [Cupriavidus taiwanensis]|nr:hypothetical protein CBM2595_A10089 [Cupriavidus taiwanensis]SPD38187.1 protein of unknown function [Cupriavidus taiwanensis]
MVAELSNDIGHLIERRPAVGLRLGFGEGEDFSEMRRCGHGEGQL